MSDDRRPAPYARPSRRWCFTNHTIVEAITALDPPITYVVWQLEVCPRTKKVHQQGYVELSRPKGMCPQPSASHVLALPGCGSGVAPLGLRGRCAVLSHG